MPVRAARDLQGAAEVLRAALRLGLTSFGGPIAHLGYLERIYGLHRAGWRGALAAWLGFTLPSALLLYACARLATRVQGPWVSALTHGLKLVAVAVVAQAVGSMERRSWPDTVTWHIAAAAIALL